MVDRPYRSRKRGAAALLATLPFALVAAPLAAQSYAVVQPVPAPAAGDLSSALQRLARNPTDFDALVAAGRASLALDDVDAAVGFFSRAETVRRGDPRVKAGLASASLKSGRPIEAIALFDEAQAAGAQVAAIAADRGLAYDLVGDNASAQGHYKLALTQARDDEVVRRLALSQAIAGDARGFEATLLPLLQRRDLASYRARAFGLAILGKEDEAISIVEAVMPRDLADRMSPYLRYMAKLTRAQQAAAANLGNFPRAAQIGRDDPRFARYAGPTDAAPASGADARLAPAGEPLGPRSRVGRRDERRQPVQERRTRTPSQPSSGTRAPPVTIVQGAPPRQVAASAVSAAPPPPPPPAAPAVQRVELPPVPAPSPTQAQPVVVASLPAQSSASGFSLQAVTAAQSGTPPPVVVVPVPVPEPTAPAATPAPEDLADAFAEFTAATTARAPAAGAVDITAIKPKREVAQAPPPPPPPPPPPKPKAPSRIWVQVATGKDLRALAFDWRRFERKAPELLGKREAFTAKWGVSQRLLTGPIDSSRTANKLVSDLKAAGIDAFTFTSEAGEEVAPLK